MATTSDADKATITFDPDGPGPAASGRKQRWAAVLAPCMSRPGEWARVEGLRASRVGALANDIRRGGIGGLSGRWEATQRGDVAWVRYLGPEEGD